MFTKHPRFRRLELALYFLLAGFAAAGLSYVFRPEKFRERTSAAATWLTDLGNAIGTAVSETTMAVINAIRDVGSPALLVIAPILLVVGLILLIWAILPSRRRGKVVPIRNRGDQDISPSPDSREPFRPSA